MADRRAGGRRHARPRGAARAGGRPAAAAPPRGRVRAGPRAAAGWSGASAASATSTARSPLEGTGLGVTGRVDRIDVDPGGRALVRDYKGRNVTRGCALGARPQLQVALYALAARDLLGLETVGALYQPVGHKDVRARGLVRDDVPGRYVNGDVVDAEAFDAGARGRAGAGGAARRATCVPVASAPARTAACRPAAAPTPRSAAPATARPRRRHDRARRAPGRGGRWRALHARAARGGRRPHRVGPAGRQRRLRQDRGHGRAVRRGGPPRRRAGRLGPRADVHREGRGRAAASACGGASMRSARCERAREAEAAWIGTIHGFCTRILRARPLAAGLDPRFTVLDEAAARRLSRARVRDGARGLGRGARRTRGRPRRRLRAGPARPPPRRSRGRCAAAASPIRGCRSRPGGRSRTRLSWPRRVARRPPRWPAPTGRRSPRRARRSKRWSCPPKAWCRGRASSTPPSLIGGRQGARGRCLRRLPRGVGGVPRRVRRPPCARRADPARRPARPLRHGVRRGQGRPRGGRLLRPRAASPRPARRPSARARRGPSGSS